MPGPEPPSDRRSFFRRSLLKMAGPVADAVERAVPLARATPPVPVLRPPGALPEADFLITCYRSGNCMDACPANAIQPLKDPDPNLSGTPVIVPSARACVVCDDLACMAACPSGALRPLAREQIHIGIAVVDPVPCVRSRGEPCVACIEHCPIGRRAIGLDAAGAVAIGAAACVGCGMCEEVCPTTPKAVRIRPHQG